MSNKNVKIIFNTISKNQWGKSAHKTDRLSPLFEIEEILKHIKSQAKKNKFRDLPQSKFCFLEGYSEKIINGKKVLLGSFKSARNEFRPNLINKRTGDERANPKLLAEGDIEKTHFAIIIDRMDNEIYFLQEYNFNGLTMNNIIDYLRFFNGQYLEKKSLPKNYSLTYSTIVKENFLESLQSLKKVKIAEIHFEKQLLGSDALKFSDKLVPLKNDLKLTIGAKPGESIKSTAVDIFNTLNAKDSKISKVRVRGVDARNNEVMIDTSFINKVEFLMIDKNKDTGELNSSQVFTGLADIIAEM